MICAHDHVECSNRLRNERLHSMLKLIGGFGKLAELTPPTSPISSAVHPRSYNDTTTQQIMQQQENNAMANTSKWQTLCTHSTTNHASTAQFENTSCQQRSCLNSQNIFGYFVLLGVVIGLLSLSLLGTRSCNSYQYKLPSFLLIFHSCDGGSLPGADRALRVGSLCQEGCHPQEDCTH